MDYPEGLMMILDDHNLWSVITTEEQKVLHNYAMRLLEFLGINAVWNHEQRSLEFIQMLLKQDYIHPDGDGGDVDE
jgi:hypothetical protein